MSDYREHISFGSPEDPFRRDANFGADMRASNTAWGWIAAGVFVVVVLAVAFGLGYQPGSGNTMASNNATPPAVAQMAPNATAPNRTTIAPPATAPTPANPAPPITPVTPAPANH
jgi:hypothetical protein